MKYLLTYSLSVFVFFMSLASVSALPSWMEVQNTNNTPTKLTQNDLLTSDGQGDSVAGTNVTVTGNFFKTIQTYMIGLLGIVSVSVFLYIGYNLFTAQGKEEEFKKAWVALVYAIIGLAVIPLAYIVVKIFTGFSL